MMGRLPLFLYRLILGAHPASFRERFGGEMMWIFEEEYQGAATVCLLFDGLSSLLRQRLNASDEPILAPEGCVYLVSDLKMNRVRLLQGGFVALLYFAGIAWAIERNGPLPVPFELRAQKCIPCFSHPQMPLQIESFRYPPQSRLNGKKASGDYK